MRCLLACLLLCACGGSSDSDPPDAASQDAPSLDAADAGATGAVPRYVYISTYRGIGIGQITDAATGAYRIVGNVPVQCCGDAVIDPTHRFLASPHYTTFDLYAIDPVSGWLTPIDIDPLSSGGIEAFAFSADGGEMFIGLTNNTIRPYHIDPSTGALTQASGAPVVSDYPTSLALTPDGTLLYALTNDNQLYAFSVTDDGALAPLAGFPIAAGSGVVTSLRIDPTGHYLAYVLDGQVAVFAIDAATGAVTEVPGSPIAVSGTPVGGRFSADGRTFYVACQTDSAVRSIALAPDTGALTEGVGSPFSTGAFPKNVYFNDNHSLAYVTLNTTPGVSIMAVGADGSLTQVYSGRTPGGPSDGIAVLSGPTPVTVRPRFVYALDDSNGGSITPYTMDDATGALTPIDNAAVTLDQPDQAVADPRGTYLYVISGPTGLHTYSIGATGVLTEIGSPIALANSPRSIAIDASGTHVIVGLAGSNDVLDFVIGANGAPVVPIDQTLPTNQTGIGDVRWDGVSRQLWFAGSSAVYVIDQGQSPGSIIGGGGVSIPAGSAPGTFAVAPDGKHVYLPLGSSSQIIGLTSLDGGPPPAILQSSPYAAGADVHGLAIHPSGAFVYATDTGNYIGTASSTVRAYSRDATTGALTPIAGTFTSLPRPYMATVDPSGKFLLVAATGSLSPTTAGGISVFPIHADGTLGTATHTTHGAYTSWVTVVGERF